MPPLTTRTNAISSGHDEWLIDEAIKESFPASDPSSLGQPGSTLGLRYPVQPRSSTGRSAQQAMLWLAAACVAGCALWLLTGRKRQQDDARP
jgi:hypothetical protein